ncbi:hypothetical protein [Desulfothermobacter acidiphilus]|uniref:hypothetical protein n=1 Tax=Desulfothermobacter acidiphilus TaxID=1938353 RepID=UPI003F887AE4
MSLKEWIMRNPGAAFLLVLAVLVVLTLALTGSLGGRGPAGQGPPPSSGQASPVKAKGPWEAAVANGPLKEVQTFRKGENADVTLGGELLQGHYGAEIIPSEIDWKWLERGKPLPATVTWGLGGKYDRARLKVGFLPPTTKKPGGLYEIFLDGRKVWEKKVTPELVAQGKAADEALELDLSGANALTLRITTAEYDAAWSSAAVPYPVVLYDIEFLKAGGA